MMRGFVTCIRCCWDDQTSYDKITGECGTYDNWENALSSVRSKNLNKMCHLKKPESRWDVLGKRIFQKYDRRDWTELL